MSCVSLVSAGVTSGKLWLFKHAIEGQRENMIFLGKRHTAEVLRQLYSYRSRKILRLFDLWKMETNEAVHVDESGEHDNDVEGKYTCRSLILRTRGMIKWFLTRRGRLVKENYSGKIVNNRKSVLFFSFQSQKKLWNTSRSESLFLFAVPSSCKCTKLLQNWSMIEI